jgi:hypothetical protein
MAEPPPYPEPGDDTGAQSTHGSASMPRWVKVFIIVAVVLALGFLVSRLLGVQHGPGLHSPPGGSGGQTAPNEPGVEEP